MLIRNDRNVARDVMKSNKNVLAHAGCRLWC